MNLVAVKRTEELRLKGVTVDAEWRDKQLATVTLTDADGKIVRFALQHYSILAFVSAPPEKKTVHVVTGTVPTLGTPIREEFETPLEADSRKRELEYAGVIESPSVAVEEVEIPF
jgi:hypothetical protein